RRVSASCRSSKHKRTIAGTALGSRTRSSPSESYSIPGSQHESDELAKPESTSVAGGKTDYVCAVRDFRVCGWAEVVGIHLDRLPHRRDHAARGELGAPIALGQAPNGRHP